MIFLKEVTKTIVERWEELGNFCIICPNKRTSDYLKNYISDAYKKTIWSPKFISISDIVTAKTDIEKADELVLMIELFKAFKETLSDTKYFNDLDFERFYGIGEIILRDFNEIDNYLVNVSDIFRNMSEIEQINYIDDYLTEEQKQTIQEFFGHFAGKNLSEEKEYFLELWSKIPTLYEKFTSALKQKKIGYNGLIIKEVVEKIKKNEVQFEEFDKYLFVGFYAITKAQKFVLNEIQKVGKAEFYWDYDNYYFKNIENEAGLFIRQNLEMFSDDLKADRNNFLSDKKISLIGFPLEISQTKALPTILKQMGVNLGNRDALSRTAIVLPDDKLLFPVLHSLPSEIEQVNVTLGFPFRNSAVFSFINKWFNLLNKLTVNQKVIADDVFAFLDNQLMKELLAGSHDFIIKKVSEIKLMYFTFNEFNLLSNNILTTLFSEQNTTNVQILLENILIVLEKIFRRISANDRTVETEAIYQFYNQMLNVQSLFNKELAEDKDIISVVTLLKFLKQMLSGVHIPFTGKSLNGLQVMTIMETRNIDFDNLIILNLNEQIIPKKASHSSLISEFMRKSFGLPIFLYQDSIFAYLFYRVLQNAKNITLTYSNLISDKGGEMSRFLQQILNETDLISEHLQYSEQIRPQRANPFYVEKDYEIYSKLSNYLNNDNSYLSASALNTYISCSLKFYFKYIAKIKIELEKETDFEIDALKFGNIFHNSMEELYFPYINKDLTNKDFSDIEKRIDTVINKQITKELENIQEAVQSGINGIITKVVKKHIINLLQFDKANLPFEIVSLEKSTKYFGDIVFEVNGKQQSINIFSIFDRVDLKNDNYKIIDYKTGSDELSIKSMEALFNQKSGFKYKGYFQMMLYSLIYRQNFPKRKFEPNIFLIKQIKDNYLGNLIFKNQVISSYSVSEIANFEEQLKELLQEIFNKDIAFSQTENPGNCEYCDFKGICGR